MRNPRAVALFLLVCLAPPTAAAQKKTTELTAATILQNVEEATAGVQDFIATIEAEVQMERLRVPKMTATMYYRKPDKVHFTSTSFAMLPREGIVLNPALLRERYNPVVLGEEMADGKRIYKLQLTGKELKIRPNELIVWIDPAVWTIVRMETVPYQGRILRLAFTYEEQTGGYWLPATLKATFESAERDSTTKRLDLGVQAPQLEEFQRPIRNGTISVKYLEYKVNVGFSDDIFEKREGASKTK
jgi:outer membrane lipoprotein-sorting protein